MKEVFYFLVVLIALTSCNNYSEKEVQLFDAEIQNYLDSTGIKMEKTEDGLYYLIDELGEGEDFIRYNDQVTFYYTGYFLDGNSFHAIDKDDPMTYKVKQLIIGWQDALMMLKNGGRIQVIIPPQLGYGKRSSKTIPKNSILKYDLTVLDVE